MAYITNEGARLIERASSEGKSIVFGSVRMNTTYKSDPASLVQQSEEWFGENHGSVVGCLSHVSVGEGSKVCDSKLAVQCNDNSKAWKSIGIYAHLDGEEGEELFACESIQNGGYEDVTIVEIPVTLDGVVADFGLSEGGSGGGGGGDVPANMMTTNTDQTGLSGMKQWLWQIYEGTGTEDKPQEGDRKRFKILSIGENVNGGELPDHIVFNRARQDFVHGAWQDTDSSIVVLDANGVALQGGSGSTWSNIINAANSGGGVPANMMTTDTEQFGLSGTKQWVLNSYLGSGSLENPQEGDRRIDESFSINTTKEGIRRIPLTIDSSESQYSTKDGWLIKDNRLLRITSDGVELNGSQASWTNIIKESQKRAPDSRSGSTTVMVVKGETVVFDQIIQPGSSIDHDSIRFTFDSSGYLTGVFPLKYPTIATIGVVVRNAENHVVENGRVSGVSMGEDTPLTFQSPIQLADAYTITYQSIFSFLI